MNAEERREYIRQIVDQAPPLTAEKRAALRVLLRPPVRVVAERHADPKEAA